MNKIKMYVYGSLGVAVLLFFLFGVGKIIEDVDAKEIVVIQAPFTGTLQPYTTAGTKWQWFGTVTRYKKSFQYWFVKNDDGDGSIKVRFNDGGHAQINGSIRVDMPMDEKSIIALHVRYGSQEAIEHALIGQLISKSVYMTGPMMSSKESNSERRTQLLGYIEDQAINGVYQTYVSTAKVKDPMDETQERTVSITSISTDKAGNPMRGEKSPVKEFNIRLYNLTINSIDYDAKVEEQIRTQQSSIMAVQIAIADAKKAEQQAYTAAKQGEAEATKIKWEQEAKNAQTIAEADGRRRAAEQDALAALQEKAANIARGQGEAERKRLVMAANGALDVKLEAWLKERQYAWEAFSKFQGNIVPQFQTGSQGGSNAMNWMDVMGMKAMNDLTLDMKTK